MNRFHILLSILALALGALAAPAGARTISGRVLAVSDSIPAGGADCKLTADGKTIATAKADLEGHFAIETPSRSALVLEVSKEDCSPTQILIEAGARSVNIGDVYLNDAVMLQEFTVEGAVSTDSKGRTIVFPASADVRASATSLSLFQKLPLPGLEANPINRTLSVDGGAPMILINGVPSTLDDVNALLPKDILKVEYSRLTPVRYADRGKSGLISITLKKRSDGGQVYLWGRSAVNTTFVDANLRAAYHQGPSQFTLYYTPSWRNYQDVYDIVEQSYIAPDFRVDLKETDRNPFNYSTHNMRLKYDYSPDTRTLFSATFSATPSTNSRRALGHSFDSELGEYDFDKYSHSRDFSPSLDFFFRRDFNEKNSLELQVVGSLSSVDYRLDNAYIYPDREQEVYKMNVDSRRRSLISEASYTHQFSDRTTLSTGYQNSISHSTNTYLDSDYRPVLTENNNYLYARVGQQVGKVYLSAGTGVKLFWTHNGDVRRHFVRNMTQAQVSWNPNSHWSLSGAFNYSSGIPSLSALTDYIQQISPYLLSNGNPNLKATQNFAYRLFLTYRTGKFQLNYSTSVNDRRNAMVNDVTYYGNHLFLRQTVNARLARSYQNYLSMRISGLKGFGASADFSVTYYQSRGDTWNHHLTSVFASIMLWWNKGPITLSYWRKILPGKYLNGHTVGKDENGDALSVDFQPNKHWTITAQWMYMFDRKGTKYPSWNMSEVNPSVSDRYIRDNGNMIVLSVQYNADFGSIFRTARRSLNNADSGSSILTR